MIVKHVLRSIRSSGVRSLLIVCSIMISAVVVFLNFTTNNDVVDQYQQLQKTTYQEYDVLVNSKSQYFTIDELSYPEEYFNGKIELSYFVIENSKGDGTYFKLMGADLNALKNEGMITVEGNLDEHSVIISDTTAERYGISVGGTITWAAEDGVQEITVTAIAESKGILQADSNFPIVVLDRKYMSEVTGLADGQLSAVLLDAKSNLDVSELVKQIESDNENFLATDLINSQQVQSNLAMIRMILIVILLIVILLNIFIVISNSKVLLEKRLFTLGIFQSIGASQSKVVGILLLENLIYSIVGSVLGIILGLMLRRPLVSAFTGNTTMDTGFNSEMILYIAFTIVFAIVLQIVSTLGQIIKQARKSIRSILFDKTNAALRVNVWCSVCGVVLAILSVVLHQVNQTYNFLYSALACICVVLATILLLPLLLKLISRLLSECVGKLLGYSVGMGMRNLGYSKPACSNVTLITVTLMIVLSIFMLSNSLSSLIRGASSQFDCDIRITGLTEKKDQYQFLQDNDYIENITPSYYSSNLVELDGMEMSFVVVGLDKEYQGIYEDGGKTITELGKDEALIDRYYATRLGISQGDTITLFCEDYQQNKLSLKIAGFVESSDFSMTRNVLVLSTPDYLDKITNVPSVLNTTVTGDDLETAKDSIRRDLIQYDVVIETVDEYLNMQLALTNGIVNMVWLILLLSVLLALVGIINNTVLGFVQRKREYAVLMSTSMSRGQALVMVFSEIVFTVFIGCVLAFGITAWLNVVLSDLLYSIGICVTVNLDAGKMFLVSGIAFVALLLTAIVPWIHMKKMVLVDELKCDS